MLQMNMMKMFIDLGGLLPSVLNLCWQAKLTIQISHNQFIGADVFGMFEFQLNHDSSTCIKKMEHF